MSDEGLRRAQKLVDEGPHWSPHPDIRDRVPTDEEWGVALVAVADLRAALAARSEPRGEGLREAIEKLPNDEQCFCEADRRVHADPDGEIYLNKAAVLALLAATPPVPSEPRREGLQRYWLCPATAVANAHMVPTDDGEWVLFKDAATPPAPARWDGPSGPPFEAFDGKVWGNDGDEVPTDVVVALLNQWSATPPAPALDVETRDLLDALDGHLRGLHSLDGCLCRERLVAALAPERQETPSDV